MRRTAIGIALGVGFLAILALAIREQIRVTCEVCIAYRGRQVCETTTAVDRAHALDQATSTACAQLSSGVTDGIQCNNTPPVFSQCSE